MTRPIAVLDLGSSSFHLLVGHVDSDGRVAALLRMKRRALLGRRTRLSAAIAAGEFSRAIESIGLLARTAHALRPARLVTVATSAVREAKNGRDFALAVERAHGIRVQVLDPVEEASLAYRGAWSSLCGPLGATAVIDLGGGSLELAVGDRDRIAWAGSLPLGALRLRNMFQPHKGSIGRERARALFELVDLCATSSTSEMLRHRPERVVLASGTARAVRDIVARISGSSRSAPLRLRQLLEAIDVLADAKPAALARCGIKRRRADTVAVAATILAAVLRQLAHQDILVTDAGLREGVLLREASGAPDTRAA